MDQSQGRQREMDEEVTVDSMHPLQVEDGTWRVVCCLSNGTDVLSLPSTPFFSECEVLLFIKDVHLEVHRYA